jgi:phosphopantothenoylcysteine synthetase/decarboxylase
MLTEFNKLHPTMKFKIDDKFPEDDLIKIMKPYILLYITSLYSLVAIIKSNAFTKLKYKLTQFYKFNPAFGRKTVVLNYSKLKVLTHIIAEKPKPHIKKYVFNDKHIDYFKTENDAFFENHKTLKVLYNADYLRILIGQRPATNTNIFLIADEEDEDEDDDDDDEDEDEDEEDNMDTENDAADTIQYEYNYEYNYNTNTQNS